jgi:polyribonucleotide nucleotidyltransferase
MTDKNSQHKYEFEMGGKTVTITTGKYAEQSNGTCFVSCGETTIMVNATMSDKPREGIDYFPLGVEFQEKMYSVGRIPGGFKKREGRPSDKAVLSSRLIDRPLRPLFPDGFFNDVSIVATALSVDPEILPEPLAMIGSSFALSISNIPFNGPTGSVFVGLIDGKFVINPSLSERENSLLDLYVSGTKDAVLMVEAGAKEVTEQQMLDAIMFGHDEIKKIVAVQEKAKAEIGKDISEKIEYILPTKEIEETVTKFAYEKLEKALATFERKERQENQDAVENEVFAHFEEIYPDNKKDVATVLYNLRKEIIRNRILTKGIRPDGRKDQEIRPIWCEVGILPRVHGTGVFTRGQTQVLTALTLGTISEAQILEGLDDEDSKRYMHQYNMPPYATAEAKPIRSTNRREIGHGALAERSLEPVIPTEEEFPYAFRLVSEVLSSNGSSSMASVCGSTLALMDAGVPIKSPVAGIAMGLIKDEKSSNFTVLTDIQGLEDFLGDMDFKVSGTKDGITAIQMDIKIQGIDRSILETALEHARIGRLNILGQMLEVISKPREQLSKYAPKIITFTINPDKIKDVIGSGGKVINKIIDETGVKIDINDDGNVFVSSLDQVALDKAKEIILSIATDITPGNIYSGKVARVLEFGAFVEVGYQKEGMIHISKLSSKRVEKVTDVVNVGDIVEVEVIKVDDRGRIDLKLIAKSE